MITGTFFFPLCKVTESPISFPLGHFLPDSLQFCHHLLSLSQFLSSLASPSCERRDGVERAASISHPDVAAAAVASVRSSAPLQKLTVLCGPYREAQVPERRSQRCHVPCVYLYDDLDSFMG